MRFEWDEAKNRGNRAKHGLSFETAYRIFSDPLIVQVQDQIVDGEQRWKSIGLVRGQLLLVVAHTIWDDDNAEETIRIISARRAEPRERRRYEEG